MPDYCTIFSNREDYHENEVWQGYIGGEDTEGRL